MRVHSDAGSRMRSVWKNEIAQRTKKKGIPLRESLLISLLQQTLFYSSGSMSPYVPFFRL